MNLRIALAQNRIKKGKTADNLAQVEEICLKAYEDHADVLVLPRMCLSGYGLADDWFNQDLINSLDNYNDYLRKLSTPFTLIWGNVLVEDGHLYDGVFCAHKGKIIYKRAKRIIKPNNIYHEERYFETKNEKLETIEIEGHKLAILMLEEMFDDSIFQEALALKPEELIVLGHKYWTKDNENIVDQRIENLAGEYILPTIDYLNFVGLQNIGKSFYMNDGKSAVYENGRRVLTLSDDFTSDYALTCDRIHQYKPNCSKLLNCLVKSIEYFDEEMFDKKTKWIIGLSGGLDSSITAVILKLALGPERIVAYNLASQYNSKETKNNAKQLAEKLKIELRNGSISSVYDASIKTIQEYGYDDIDTLTKENIQARIRGHLLASFAQIEHGVIINNGNKVEVAMGYATLYGDTIGTFSPIGDLFKVELFKLAHEINAYFNDEIISERLLPKVNEYQMKWDMAPSAELRSQQTDPMKWYYHDLLIEYLLNAQNRVTDLLQSYIDGSIYNTELGLWLKFYHLDKGPTFIEDLEWVMKQLKFSTFKRLQMPPVLIVSEIGFGDGRIESQGLIDEAKLYQELKQRILTM